jgi:glycine cleavage system regulatory protein
MIEINSKQLSKRFEKVCENLCWAFTYDESGNVELSKYSPAGEDFSFSVEVNGFVENVKEYSANFDIDEHVEMWIQARKNKASGVPTTRELVKDAEDISEMLKELSSILWKAELVAQKKCIEMNAQQITEALLSLKTGESLDFAKSFDSRIDGEIYLDDCTGWYGVTQQRFFASDILIISYYGGGFVVAIDISMRPYSEVDAKESVLGVVKKVFEEIKSETVAVRREDA